MLIPFGVAVAQRCSMHLLFPKHLSRLLGHDWGARALLSCPQLAEKACVDHFLYGGEQTFLWSAATRVINEVINQYGRPFLPVRDKKNILQTDDVLIYSSRFIVFSLDRCDFDLFDPSSYTLFCFLSSSPDRTGLSERGWWS